MAKLSFSLVSLLLGFAILWAVISSIGIGEIWKVFSQFSPLGVIPLLGLTVSAHVVSGIKWQYILSAMGIRVPLIPLLKILFVGYAISYVTPIVFTGGEVFRGYFLRERYGVEWTKALSSVFIDKILEAAVWMPVILLGAAIFLFEVGIDSLPKAIMVSLISISIFAVFLILVYAFSFRRKSVVSFLLRKILNPKGSTARFLYDVEKDFFSFFSSSNKKYIAGTIKLSILKYFLLWVRNIFIILYVAHILSLSGSFVGLGFSYLSYTAPVPAAMGVQEGLLSLVFSSLGFQAGMGTVFSFLLRGAEMFGVGVGFFFLVRWGLGKFTSHITTLFKNGLTRGA